MSQYSLYTKFTYIFGINYEIEVSLINNPQAIIIYLITEDPMVTLLLKTLRWLYYWRSYGDFITEDPMVTLLLKILWWLYYWRPYGDFIIEDPMVTLLLKILWWLYYW
jgi:hypothetical protein